MRSSPARIQKLFARFASAALLGCWMLLSVQCETVFPRQSWNLEWGTMVPHTKFPGDCSVCHVPERWDVIRADFQFDRTAA